MNADLMRQLAFCDIVSFDVFDTLLLRPYLTQEDLWLDLGRGQFGEKDGDAFLKARIAADKKTYLEATRRGGEHTLEEAYGLMPRRFAVLREQEESLQRECLTPNLEMAGIWKRAGELGKKRIIVSDMYLSEVWFEETLKEKGFGEYDALYVSSACQARKSTGALFEKVLQDFPGKSILHIGDHPGSDVIRAKEKGLSVHRVERADSRFFRDFPFAKRFIECGCDLAARKTIAAMIVGWAKYRAENPDVSYWQKLGFVQAGLLGSIFIRWIIPLANQHGIRHLAFVARDGYIWQRLCQVLYPEIKTSYVYAPRAALTCATADLGSSPNVQKDRSRLLTERLKSVVGYETTPEHVHAVVLGFEDDPALRQALNALQTRTLERYCAYLESQDSDQMAVVDGCSFEFSVQRLLRAALGRDVPTFYLASMAPMQNAASLFATEGKTLSFQALTEFMFGSPEAPIADVTSDGPVYGESAKDESFKRSVSKEICAGAIACARSLVSLETLMSPDEWVNWVEEHMRNLTSEDNENLARAKNSTDINHALFFGVAWRPLDRDRLVRRPLLAKMNVRIRFALDRGVRIMRLTLGRFTLYCRKQKVFGVGEDQLRSLVR